MKWTDKPPTEPGWYWHRFAHDLEAGSPAVVEVLIGPSGHKLARASTARVVRAPRKEFWAGPIPEPESE